MRDKEMELDWSITEGFDAEEDEMDVLDESELDKLQFLAEHPELEDPLFLFVPEKRKKRRGGGEK